MQKKFALGLAVGGLWVGAGSLSAGVLLAVATDPGEAAETVTTPNPSSQ